MFIKIVNKIDNNQNDFICFKYLAINGNNIIFIAFKPEVNGIYNAKK